MTTYVINPFTNHKIAVGGRAHQIVQQVMAGTGSDADKRKEYAKLTHVYKKTKYSDVPEQYFCGPAGGYPAGSHNFPVDSPRRCSAALSYARNAPDPQGIRECALKIAKEKGWNCGKYSHPGKKKKTGPRKVSGYQLFIKAELPKLKAKGITGKNAITQAAASWKKLTKAEKAPFIEQAAKLPPQ